MQGHTIEFTLEALPAFGLALLIICTFAFISAVLSGRRPHPNRQRRQPVAEGLPLVMSEQSHGSHPVAEPKVEPVEQWLQLLFDLAAHIVILGGSGSGKTRTARGLVRYIIEQRHERVLVLDPKANLDTWMGLPALVQAKDIDAAMRAVLAEFQCRLDKNPTLTEVEAEQAFERVWIVVDEVSFVRDNCKLWPAFLRRISSMARSLKIHLIIVNQSERVEELGLRGRGDLLANFARIGLSQAVWRGEPALITIGGLSIFGVWQSYFPEAYRGRRLPAAGAYIPFVSEAQGSFERPSHTAGTALVSADPVPTALDGQQRGVGTGSTQILLADLLTDHDLAEEGESEAEKIRRLAAQGWSRNQIAAELGGRRAEALARIRTAIDGVNTFPDA